LLLLLLLFDDDYDAVAAVVAIIVTRNLSILLTNQSTNLSINQLMLGKY